MKFKINEIIEIQWLDTSTTSEWTTPEGIEKATPTMVKTVGYYGGCKRIGKTVRWITVKHNLASDGNADFTIIPYGCVVKVERVER